MCHKIVFLCFNMDALLNLAMRPAPDSDGTMGPDSFYDSQGFEMGNEGEGTDPPGATAAPGAAATGTAAPDPAGACGATPKPPDCYAKCNEEAKKKACECKAITKAFVEKMKEAGCTSTRCTTGPLGKTCKKRAPAKKKCAKRKKRKTKCCR